MDDHSTDPITTPATFTGAFGRTWRLDVAALLRKNGRDPAEDAGIDLWMVEAPHAHPAWHTYMLLIMHLRPIEGAADPMIYLPGATHEFELWALSPDAKRQKIIDDGGAWGKWALHPINFAAQIIATDEEAKTRLFASVMDIINGVISPDTDYMQWWIQAWGNNMLIDNERFVIPPVKPPEAKQ
jgi:hypothetical protein